MPLDCRIRGRRTWTAGTAALLAAAAVVLSSPAAGQTELGGQRVGTSSATFLKIGLDARGAALANAYTAVVEGPVATFFNPAGILAGPPGPALQAGITQWPADLTISAVSASVPLAALGGRLAAGVAFLGTRFDETTEYYPAGTGRTAAYSDFLGTLSFARRFTDRLGIGATVKYFREEMAANLGGPVLHGFLIDAGTSYALGYRASRVSITLANFGSDLDPDGSFDSRVTGGEVSYTAFSPPTQFQLGFAIDPWSSGPHRVTATTVILHQADTSETLRGGVEYRFREDYAVRTGYDFAADEMGFSAGLGAAVRLGGRRGTLDYAWTEGGYLDSVHRFGVGISL